MNIFQLDSSRNSTVTKKDRSVSSLNYFLRKKEVTTKGIDTHTTWGWVNKKYHIPIDDNKEFLKLYSKVVEHGLPDEKCLTFTEKPLEYSPIYVDIDFKILKEKYNISDGLFYNDNLLKRLIRIYYMVFKEFIDVKEGHMLSYIFEKQGLEDKKLYWGCGIHIIFPNICINNKLKHIIRKKVITKCIETKLFDIFDNKPDDIIDESIIDRNKIMLYGSKKPESKYYYHFTKLFNHNCDELDIMDAFDKENVTLYDLIKKFSLRNKKYNKFKSTKLKKEFNDNAINTLYYSLGINNVSTYDMKFDDNISDDIIDVKHLVNLLSPERADSYDTWSKVGFCLNNIDKRLLDTFVDFSKLADKVNPGRFAGKTAISKFWSKINLAQKNIGLGSLHFWAKQDNPKRYEDFLQSKKNSAIENNIDSNIGEYKLAKSFKTMYSNKFVCSGLEGKTIWWEFSQYLNRWIRSEGGYKIKGMIPEEFAKEWYKFRMELSNKYTNLDPNDPNNKILKEKCEKISKIISKLYKHSTIESMTKLLSTLYYDNDFNKKIDELHYNLIGFKNGVFDLNEMTFRQGRPDDFISLSTNIDYIPYDKNSIEIKEINNFFNTVLVNKNVREYFLTVLSTCLHGENKEQKMWICTGSGSNGKSVTFDLLKKAFGTYFITPRVELFTRKSVGSGQANESMCDLKAKRIAVLQEPDDGEKIHSGTLKPLVAGNDEITSRRLFQGNISFTPRCKFFMTANDKPDISDTSDGTWRRIRVIDFKSKFVSKPLSKCNKKLLEFPIDISIGSKLDTWAPHLISMLIHKYYPLYVNGKLEEPDEVKLSTDQYQLDNNYYKQFFQEKITKTGNMKDRVSFKDIWTTYNEWFDDDGDKSKSKFKGKKRKLLECIGRLIEQPKNKKYFYGIGFIEDDDEDDDNVDINV